MNFVDWPPSRSPVGCKAELPESTQGKKALHSALAVALVLYAVGDAMGQWLARWAQDRARSLGSSHAFLGRHFIILVPSQPNGSLRVPRPKRLRETLGSGDENDTLLAFSVYQAVEY